MKKKLFAANWKLNKTPEEAREFVISLKNAVYGKEGFFNEKEIVLFPQAFSIEAVSSLCAGTEIGYGPQNVYFEVAGAFTGENSAEVAKKMKCGFLLIGHSERREIFKEDNDLLNKKMQMAQGLGMIPVLCIGESLAQRERGETLTICFLQLEKALNGLKKDDRLVVAYEPVWAIGTGKIASVQQVAEVHLEIFRFLEKSGFSDFQVLYGGSVKPENSEELLKIPHVDGFLIGGAALQVDSFLKICGK